MPQSTPLNKSQEAQAKEDPQHPHWLNVFSLFSWWESKDGRAFVIRQRWLNREHNQVVYLELLEQNKEVVKTVFYEDFFKKYKQGLLTKTSRDDGEEEMKYKTGHLWPERD